MKFKRVSFAAPAVEVEVSPSPLEDASLPERFAPPAPPSNLPALQPFGGPQQHSRLNAFLGAPTAFRWVSRFEAPLREGTEAQAVLYSGDAVLVLASIWQLFGVDGAARRSGLSGLSPVVISPTDDTFRWVSADGTLVARALQTGEERWSCGAPLGDGGAYPVHAVGGTASLLAGAERDTDPEAEDFVPAFAVQWIDPTERPVVSRGGLLKNAVRTAALTGPSMGDLVGATDGAHVFVAFEGLALRLDMALEVTKASSFAAKPRAVSMGDAGRVYLVVSTPGGAALWLINAQGERVFAAALPRDTRVPPIVTPDHRVFVTTDDEVLAFSPEGRPLWRVSSPLRPPRASVTADGWLLVSLGEELRAFDAEGRSAVLSYSVGRPFVTAPVITAHGEILVATTETLVCLSYEALTFAAGYRPA
jgi:outer membrane protein assembly factor BamB